MNTPFDLSRFGEGVVYVRPVRVADLPDDLRAQAGDRKELFAVHNSEGEQLALVADRQMAFYLARENDMTPVAVH